MALRENSVDNLIQWHYMMEDDVFIIEFLGLNFRTECKLLAAVPFPEPDWKEFDETLDHEVISNADAIRKEITSFEKWHLFTNPYKRLEIVASELEKKLGELQQIPLSMPARPRTRDSAAEYEETMRRLTRTSLELLTYSTVLQQIAPVLGESAVNLLIYATAHDSIRSDDRMLQDTFRRNIDIRVKKLHIDCRGFSHQVDQNKGEFKDFMRLMNRRNDALHGNVDPRRHMFADPIYFDQRTIPLTDCQKTLSQFTYDHIMAGTSADSALGDLRIARNFVEFLFSCLNPDVEKQIRQLFKESQLGFRPLNSRVGMILPNVFADIAMVPSE